MGLCFDWGRHPTRTTRTLAFDISRTPTAHLYDSNEAISNV
jgi:hypothetical protein